MENTYGTFPDCLGTYVHNQVIEYLFWFLRNSTNIILDQVCTQENILICLDCECDAQGSFDLSCTETGICNCKSNIFGTKCNEPCKYKYFF